MSLKRQIRTAAELDLAEVLRSRWLYFCFGLYAVLAAVFVFVGMRESSVLGFTGMGRALFSLCHALVLLLPLLALVATGQSVGQARDEGSLELLLGQPLGRLGWFAGLTLVRVLVLLLPLVLLFLGLALLGRVAFAEAVSWSFLLTSMAVCASLVWAFIGLGLLIAVAVRSQARAMIAVLLAWALAVALMDFGLIGLMLQWQINPQGVFVLAAANPVQAARLALLSGAEPELSVFGPVGFHLANRVGSAGLLALGVVWPALLGTAFWVVAYRRFRSADLV
jgi:ABC-type transport system involved in multi-copper enzyme maturation permease subunit